MGAGYFEIRKQPARSNSISTDMMRHLHTRQYLGKAIIVGTQPTTMLSAARKQWLKLSRYIQKQRAATLDADKILKYTHTVTHMQHLRFTAKSPLEETQADVYFMSPQTLDTMPPNTCSVYLTVRLEAAWRDMLLAHLPDDALVVDYASHSDWKRQGLEPKDALDTHVHEQWQQLTDFLNSYHINIKRLGQGPLQDIDAMEEALDILLGTSHKFLRIASQFQHALELARPLQVSKTIRLQYDAAALLAHRVQALSTGGFSGQFLEAYNEDDAFFLYDRSRGILPLGEEPAEAIARQVTAGRHHLAEALRRQYAQPGPHRPLAHELLSEAQTV